MTVVRKCVAVALLAASVAAQANDQVPSIIDGTTYTQPQRLIEVEPGRHLNLYCVGVGEPTVVFEAGLTDPINVWGLVQAKVASKTRACAYDRAGIGFSDGQSRPSSSANIVEDLHRLLKAADIDGPIVLVAHSSAGMHARLYAYRYPEAVAGLVLIDPSHEDQTETFRKLDPQKRSVSEWDEQVLQPSLDTRRECIKAAETGIAADSDDYRKCSFPQYPQLSAAVKRATETFQLSLKFQRAQLSEEESVFHASVDELRLANRSLGNMPLIVLTKDRPAPPEGPLTADQLRLREARYDAWKGLGAKSASSSTAGVQRVVSGAGHGIQLEKPEAVIAAIEEVTAKVKSGH